MKRLLQIATIMILGMTLLYGDAFEKTATSNATNVIISSEKPLALGSNTLLFQIKNEKYKDAEMDIKVFMPAMPGMPYMGDTAKAQKTDDGKYKANLNFMMRGTWQVYIILTPNEGKKVRIKSSLNI